MSSFNGYYGILFLLSILILGLLFGKPVMSYIEGFSNANGDPLLDSFPSTGEKNVNDNTYSITSLELCHPILLLRLILFSLMCYLISH